ncbi:alginate lyase family protein [Flammeovirgaceae bacterium SG7u.111]|nr:alginate lyase family protein [Flammeovirgaceae bacterium SG7u.132]WPO36992.1 alginate lyase family protein [Flammeovirgaceae bacterium SG7u.111]
MTIHRTITHFFAIFLAVALFSCSTPKKELPIKVDTDQLLKEAEANLSAQIITVTDSFCERSAGSPNDFYSEGDYWWPDPENPDSAYIRRDGMTNPENFTLHREWMVRFSKIAGSLASAYVITGDEKYLNALIPHLEAWFMNPTTKMKANLMFGQAIKGRVTGRGIGIIDTIHLIEVAKAVQLLQRSELGKTTDLSGVVKWFEEYLQWMTTHEYGLAERDNGNNHSSTWALQVAAFADLTQNEELKEYTREMYKTMLLPQQMNSLGGFPLELKRTKPYNYSLFNLDALATTCFILSTPEENLFEYSTPDGRSLALGMEFMYPFIADKSGWTYEPDVLYWDEWPVKHPSLLFAGIKLGKPSYLALFDQLTFETNTFEVLRNMPVRYPLIWVAEK